MPRVGGFSSLLTGAAIPLCCWGLISTLVLHLIELRTLFIAGGEWRLRQATLAFAAAVVLIQRLAAIHGKSLARTYAAALAVAITLFALHNAYTYRLPVHPFLVFAANETLFLVLWWVGHNITRACSADPDSARAAAESGIFSRRSREKRIEDKEQITEAEMEARWAERLPKRHPGRVILYFSLFAIPAFGLGVYLLDSAEAGARLRLAVLLFVYLWCAFALLFLSSLGQLHAYFEKRGVSLPDQIGLVWLSIGGFVVTAALIAAIFLPQPPSLSAVFLRHRIVSVYRGWESRYGVRDSVGSGGAAGQREPADRPFDTQAGQELLKDRYAPVDKLGDAGLSQIHRDTGWEPEYRNVVMLTARANESLRKIFDFIVKALGIVAIVCGLVAAYAAILAVARGLSQSFAESRLMRKAGTEDRKRRRRKKTEQKPQLGPGQFGKFGDPFFGPAVPRDGNALVRYLWEAMLAFCADQGTPCPSDQTPYEFVASKPWSLEGFEESARYIADLFVLSEFSGQPVADSAVPGLKQFWKDLNRHASRVPSPT